MHCVTLKYTFPFLFYLHKGVRLSTPIKFQLNSEMNDRSSDFILGYESEVKYSLFLWLKCMKTKER